MATGFDFFWAHERPIALTSGLRFDTDIYESHEVGTTNVSP